MRNAMEDGYLKIHCIGDSHASFFSGSHTIQPEWPGRSHDVLAVFASYRVGPATAYNLTQENSTTRGREKLFEILDILEPGSKVLLCFGEIDCRVHLLRQSREQGRAVKEVVKECVNRYATVIDEVRARGFEVIMWNVIPSTLNGEIVEKDYVAYGSCKERNEVTKLFNQQLERIAQERQLKIFGIFDELIDENGLTDIRWYADKIHVSQRAMPMVIQKLRQLYPHESMVLFSNPVLSKLSYGVQLFILKVASQIKAWGFKIIRAKNKLKAVVYKKIKSV